MYRIGDIVIYWVPTAFAVLTALALWGAWRGFRARRRLWRGPAFLLAALAPLLMAETVVGIPVVLNNNQLSLLPSFQQSAVLRLGFYTPGDVAPAWFTGVSGTCTADGFTCVASADSGGHFTGTPQQQCIFALEEFGTRGDGVSDDTGVIQGAINAAVACHNGTLKVPARRFALTGVTIGGAVKIKGANTAQGSNSQFINLGSNNNLISLASGVVAVEIDDLAIQMAAAAGTQTAGWAINASVPTAGLHIGLIFRHLAIGQACGGIVADANRVTIEQSLIYVGGGPACDGILLGDQTTAEKTVEVRLIHNWIVGTGVKGSPVGGAGIHIEDGGDVMLDFNSVLYMTNGLAATPGASQAADMHGTGNLFDTMNGAGIVLQPSGGKIIRTRLFETWQSNGASGTRFGVVPNAPGILVNPNGGSINDVAFDGGQILGNTAQNILISGGTNIAFRNFQNICGVFGVAGASAPAIELAAGASATLQNDTITQNCDGTTTYSKQNYGVQLDGGNTILLTGNTITGQSLGPLSGTPGAGSVIANNKGIDDVQPTIPSAASIALPPNPVFVLSGSTAVATMTGSFAGMRAKRILPQTAGGTLPAFNAGGNLCNALTPGAGQGVSVVFDQTSNCLRLSL